MIWRLEVCSTAGTFDVMVDADLASSTKDLVAELERLGFVGATASGSEPVHVDGVDVTSVDTIGELPLRHGSTVHVGTVEESVSPDLATNTGLQLVSLFGPDAGRRWTIGPGRWSIGRSAHNHVVLADGLMSGAHAVLTVGGDLELSIQDLASTNGTFVEGRPLSDGHAGFATNQYIQLGSSVLSVVDISAAELAVVQDEPGPDVALQRRFREAEAPLPRRLTPPSEPSDTSSNSSWWRALMPLVTGIGFAYLTGRWEFLLIMALAPIVFAVDMYRKKRQKIADTAAALANYEREKAAFDASVGQLRDEERSRQRNAAIGGGVGALLATVRHRRLWERLPSDADFANLTVGLAALPSEIDAGDHDEILGAPTLWGTPLQASLLETGCVSLLGPTPRTRSLQRAMVVGLGASHSPADLNMWIFSDEDAVDEWRFARWLPHAFSGARTSSIAFTKADRAALLSALKQILDTRSDAAEHGEQSGAPTPLHLVVVDRATLIADADLTDLLLRGPDVGIIALVADPVITPEGVNGTLTLGTAADDATYESRVQPLVPDLRTAEMDPATAEVAARALATLRPTMTGEGSTGMNGVVHLTEMLGLEGITPQQLVDRWDRMSPQTAATIGMSSEMPMTIDIAEHGPHGLVGGMSGSGKTEFLMTLLSSLCLNNHPDDLAIVIVDFKGGVDHALTSQLPHVVGLSTNLHIGAFKRTIDLLDAEQRRRQSLLAGIGGDLDAYRTARLSQPDLPPLPRLLVIVDEFSELLASDEGKERLQELVRVTRIGRALGVHLLLVTQNFEGQLPPQVEANAGLRVCLRVMKPSHSKVVLDSGVASTIPDTRVGRAYARLNGRDLVEFQTARVAGRRRDLATGPPPLEIQRTPVEALCTAATQRREGKPPTDETDMSALIATCWDAVEATGWSTSAVPWPTELPAEPDLREVLPLWEPVVGSAPIAIADCPDQQRHDVLAITESDEQVLFLGGPGAALGEAMITTATSLAVLHSPDDLHIHAIDLEGAGLVQLQSLPHVGTIATRDEALSLQLLKYLNTEVAERRAAMVTRGVTHFAEINGAQGSDRRPDITVFVAGADRMVRRGEDRSQLLSPLLNLLSEAINTGVWVVLAGLPAVADSRLGSNIERRFVFKMPGDVKAASYGAPRELSADLENAGRCVDVNNKLLVQFASVKDPVEVAERLADKWPAESVLNRPKTFVSVTWPYPMENIDIAYLQAPSDLVRPLPIGVDIDTGEVAWVDAEEDGPVMTVAGGPKSGRSTTLISIARMAKTVGWHTIAIAGSRRSPILADEHQALFDVVCSARRFASEAAPQLGELPADAPVLLLVDDLHRIDADDLDLGDFFSSGRPVAALIAASPDFLGGRDDALRLFPAARGGVLVAPTGFSDGSAIGLSGRLTDEQRANPRAGRGLLGIAGEAREIQIPL